jgi:CRP-like cAMP-binding protein
MRRLFVVRVATARVSRTSLRRRKSSTSLAPLVFGLAIGKTMADVINSKPEVPIDPELIAEFCDEVTFAPGEALKRKGDHSQDMFLLTDGEVEIALETPGKPTQILTRQRGSPIGENSFLTGVTVTANVTARARTKALRIDDKILQRIEHERPELAADLYRQFAEVSEGRQSYNLLFFAQEEGSGKKKEPKIDIKICRTPEMLL